MQLVYKGFISFSLIPLCNYALYSSTLCQIDTLLFFYVEKEFFYVMEIFLRGLKDHASSIPKQNTNINMRLMQIPKICFFFATLELCIKCNYPAGLTSVIPKLRCIFWYISGIKLFFFLVVKSLFVSVYCSISHGMR